MKQVNSDNGDALHKADLKSGLKRLVLEQYGPLLNITSLGIVVNPTEGLFLVPLSCALANPLDFRMYSKPPNTNMYKHGKAYLW